MGCLRHRHILLLHQLHGRCLGQTSNFPTGKPVIVHQQRVGILRSLLPFSPSIPSGRLCRHVAVRDVSSIVPMLLLLADGIRLVTSTIADLYFVHQRGLRLAMWGLCLSVGVGGGGIISGYIIQDLGWNWTYGIVRRPLVRR